MQGFGRGRRRGRGEAPRRREGGEVVEGSVEVVAGVSEGVNLLHRRWLEAERGVGAGGECWRSERAAWVAVRAGRGAGVEWG